MPCCTSREVSPNVYGQAASKRGGKPQRRGPSRQDPYTKYSLLDVDTNEVAQALSRKGVYEEICLAGRVPQRLDTYTEYSTHDFFIFFDEAESTT